MNHKQQELLDDIISGMTNLYSEFTAQVLEEDGDTIHLRVKLPKDDDENWNASEDLATKLTNILVDTGYYFEAVE